MDGFAGMGAFKIEMRTTTWTGLRNACSIRASRHPGVDAFAQVMSHMWQKFHLQPSKLKWKIQISLGSPSNLVFKVTNVKKTLLPFYTG
mmetsp:Transcript_12817/g.22830  ORF Transcript_12817/g.22830 Transcript_12817/m.22830 type:complete len:89 (+) Transcript_12817:391-657(+)